MSLLDHALDARARGLMVFALQPRDKTPFYKLCPDGSLNATDNDEIIRWWWKREPTANIGVRGGTIIDCDEGIHSLQELENFMMLRDLPRTLVIKTGRMTSYGCQLHYRQQSTSGNYSVNCVSGEVRSGNLYGTFAGSVHPSGAKYEIAIDTPIADVPADLFREYRTDGSGRRKIGGTDIIMDYESARETFFKLLHQAAHAQKGSRHTMAHRVSWFGARAYLSGVFSQWTLGDVILYPALTEAQVKTLIYRAVKPLYKDDRRDVRKMLRDSWNSGLKAGKLPLELFKEDYEILRACSSDPVFHDAWCGVTSGFDSALAAKQYLLERLAAVGCEDVDAARIVRAGDILDAVATEIKNKLILAPYMTGSDS